MSNIVKDTHTYGGQKYNLGNKDKVAASAATQAINTATVTQATNNATAVTINAYAGVITTAGAAIANATNVEFLVNNNKVQADSVILVTTQDENTTDNTCIVATINTVTAGSFKINLNHPDSVGTTSATASKIHFLVINNDG
tara:strand:- start:1480 stop:1905 length:426 start_codon:yes stop_codon:yes gene_type:complete